MGRTHRPLIADATYFVTSTTNDRHPWFAYPDYAQTLVDQWRHYEQAYEFSLHTYCVLPDHAHVVLTVGPAKNISQILRAVHSYTVTLISKKMGGRNKPRVWQGDAWDEVIRDDDMYWQKIAYVLLNPWREGLVDDPLAPYAFSDVGAWIAREGQEFLLDLFSRHRRRYE